MTAYTATVTVRLKRGVLDPEAETTQQALERLGFELEDLRSTDRFEIDLSAESAAAAEDRATQMAERLLANPTIHDYEVAVAETNGGVASDDVAADGGVAEQGDSAEESHITDGDTGA